MARFRSASSTKTNCHSWRLDPVGAWTATWRHSSSSSRGTGRSKSSRLRTARVVVRISSTPAGTGRGSAAMALQLQTIAQRVVPLELLQGQRALGPLGVLGRVDRLQQEVDVLGRQAEPVLVAMLDDLRDRVGDLDGGLVLLDDARTAGRSEQLLGA